MSDQILNTERSTLRIDEDSPKKSQESLLDDRSIEQTVRVMKALSDEIRVRLLLLLKEDEACVCELMEVFGMSQSRISHHLILLRDAGFLRDEKRGKWNYYRADTRTLDTFKMGLLETVTRGVENSATARDDRKTFENVKARLRINC